MSVVLLGARVRVGQSGLLVVSSARAMCFFVTHAMLTREAVVCSDLLHTVRAALRLLCRGLWSLCIPRGCVCLRVFGGVGLSHSNRDSANPFLLRCRSL